MAWFAARKVATSGLSYKSTGAYVVPLTVFPCKITASSCRDSSVAQATGNAEMLLLQLAMAVL